MKQGGDWINWKKRWGMFSVLGIFVYVIQRVFEERIM